MRRMRTKVWAVAAVVLLAIGTPLAAQSEEPAGVIVTGVDPDGPSAAAGIERGDLILGIDGQDVGSASDLMQALAAAEGSEVTLSVKHGDDMRDQVVAIDRVWGRARIGLMITGGAGANLDFDFRRGGDPDGRRFQFRFDNMPSMPGVVVWEVAEESPAASAGLQRGDWITAVGGVALDGPAGQLAEIIGGHAPGDEVTVEYQRGGEEMSAMVTLGESADSGAALLGIRYQALPMFNDGDMRRFMEGLRERFERRWRTDPDREAAPSGDVDADSAL